MTKKVWLGVLVGLGVLAGVGFILGGEIAKSKLKPKPLAVTVASQKPAWGFKTRQTLVDQALTSLNLTSGERLIIEAPGKDSRQELPIKALTIQWSLTPLPVTAIARNSQAVASYQYQVVDQQAQLDLYLAPDTSPQDGAELVAKALCAGKYGLVQGFRNPCFGATFQVLAGADQGQTLMQQLGLGAERL